MELINNFAWDSTTVAPMDDYHGYVFLLKHLSQTLRTKIVNNGITTAPKLYQYLRNIFERYDARAKEEAYHALYQFRVDNSKQPTSELSRATKVLSNAYSAFRDEPAFCKILPFLFSMAILMSLPKSLNKVKEKINELPSTDRNLHRIFTDIGHHIRRNPGNQYSQSATSQKHAQ